MDPRNGRIYQDDETAHLSDEVRRKFVTISDREAAELSKLPEADRPAALLAMRTKLAQEQPALHPLGRLPGLTDDDVRRLRNSAKRARRARRRP